MILKKSFMMIMVIKNEFNIYAKIDYYLTDKHLFMVTYNLEILNMMLVFLQIQLQLVT